VIEKIIVGNISRKKVIAKNTSQKQNDINRLKYPNQIEKHQKPNQSRVR
jgi:hypothetical protein